MGEVPLQISGPSSVASCRRRLSTTAFCFSRTRETQPERYCSDPVMGPGSGVEAWMQYRVFLADGAAPPPMITRSPMKAVRTLQ